MRSAQVGIFNLKNKKQTLIERPVFFLSRGY